MEEPQGAVIRKIPGGVTLYQEGEQARCVYIVKSGWVELTRGMDENQVRTTVGPRGVVGAVPFLTGDQRLVRAVAMEETEVLEIGTDLRDQAMAALPKWAAVLLRDLCTSFRDLSDRLADLKAITTGIEKRNRQLSRSLESLRAELRALGK